MDPANPNDPDKPSEKRRERAKKWIVKQLKVKVPIIVWLPKYNWKKNVLFDILAGLAVGFIYVTQGLAFAILARSTPQSGLVTCVYPLIIYIIFGTASISSVGPVSVPSMMTGNVVLSLKNFNYTTDGIISCITLFIGIFFMFAHIFKLHVFFELFNKPLHSAFFLVSTSQIFVQSLIGILGLQFEMPDGYFSIFVTVYLIAINISNINFFTLGFSTLILLIILMNSLYLRPFIRRYTSFVIPVETILIIGGISISYGLSFKDHAIHVVGMIPKGLPSPIVPKIAVAPHVISQTVIITLVIFFASITVLFMINVEIDARQELFAYSLCNLIGSFFRCLPVGNAMMRSLISQAIGSRSLISSLVSAIFVFICLLWASPLLAPLPTCILTCVVISGVFTLMQKSIREIPNIFKSGWENIFIWVLTVFVSVAISIEGGMFVGLLLSMKQFIVKNRQETLK